MRCACIDIGSNTTALLVAEFTDGQLTPVATERSFTMLGSSARPEGISESKIEAVAAAVASLLDHARGLGAESIELIATHVVREAHNGQQLEAAVLERTGVPVEVIDGHAEARFSFIGATGGLHRVAAPTVVIDAGGGSTEVSWCAPGEQPVTASIAIGSASLRRRFLAGDPPLPEELTRARAHAESELAQLSLPADLKLALAVGGGATTARQLTGGLLDAPGIARVLALTTSLSSAELARRFELPEQRALLLPAGLTILDAASALVGTALEVGLGGVREGVLIDRHAQTY